MEPTLSPHIEILPGKCGGKPCITGTRVRVWDVYVLHELEGKTPDEITIAFPGITLAQVHAALAYYFDNKAEIDAQMRAADEFVEALKKATGPGPLAQKLARIEAGSDSISS